VGPSKRAKKVQVCSIVHLSLHLLQLGVLPFILSSDEQFDAVILTSALHGADGMQSASFRRGYEPSYAAQRTAFVHFCPSLVVIGKK